MKRKNNNVAYSLERRLSVGLVGLATCLIFGAPAMAQTGVDDDRVSLPEGPGSLEGVGENVEVDPNMGAMSYSVPISLPSGINGFSPSLGLGYSSSAGSSVVGVGWSIAVPSIERFTARGTPRYQPDDVFASNGGEELVMVDEADGKQVYRERFEGAFTRYTWHGVGEGEAGYWTAEYADGSVAYFGADSDGNLVDAARSAKEDGGTYKYHIVERVDAYGHRIVYDYNKFDSNWPLLTQISWVFDENDNPIYQASLAYEDRQDFLSDAGAGYEELLTKRLAGVQVTANQGVVREYDLGYEDYSTSGGFTRLTDVDTYGKGGKMAGELYPIKFTFGYSNALGMECVGADCDSPYLVSMGQQGAASGLASGKATLVDINADGLPDVVDTSGQGAHRILINRITPTDSGVSSTFDDPVDSAQGTGGNFALGGDQITQVVDVNGDGLSDLLNTRTGTTLMSGYGLADWQGSGQSIDVGTLQSLDMADAKFMDYNNDKLIDLIVSTADSTVVYENLGDDFKVVTVDPIGVQLAGNDRVQLADMNGDGYQDVVEVNTDGSMRYRINFGWGAFSEWRTITGVTIPSSELELVDLEDLNGDGISDVVIVTATQVKYAINRNGNRFDSFVSLTSADIDGSLPERSDGDIVLFADMNANGSEDIVWFDAAGEVKYLELFPVRPNLLSRVDNGIGSIQLVDYTTSAIQEAQARIDGDAWTKSLSLPMNIVGRLDTFVTLTGGEDGQGLHDITTYAYRDGFYDGVEKQFRGFERVIMTTVASESQEGGETRMVFDLGEDEPHRNGLLLEQSISSGGREIVSTLNVYEDCDVDGIPTAAELTAQGRFPVKFACMTSAENVLKEGQPESDWVTVREESEFDGYGNVTKMSTLGVVGVTGDEMFTETRYIDPETNERWLVGLPSYTATYAIDGGAIRTESNYYYDGEDFVGVQSGLTHGFLTRMTDALDEATVRETLRQRRDDHGNVVQTIDALGAIGDESSHHRFYGYDELGLFMTNADVNVREGHVLRRRTAYEYDFQNLTDVTDWVLIKDGEVATPENLSRWDYDDFGRMIAEIKPGDDAATPSTAFEYELGEPFSRVVVKARSTRNGPVDEEGYRCMDGRGRLYQTRLKTADGDYLVSGFKVLNSRGAQVEIFQPYTSESAECERERPAGVLSSTFKHDAQFRVIESSDPGEEVFGERLLSRTEYEPLKMLSYDFEDTDEDSPHFNTPDIFHKDGLGRDVMIERVLAEGDSALYQLHYDETGSFSGYTDPDGNRHEMSVDLLGRITAVRNPSIGEYLFEYDIAGNLVSQTDARGVKAMYGYDGANRLVAQWDAADEAGTKIEYTFDERPEACALTECTNPANRVVMVSFPTPWGTGRDWAGYDARGQVVFEARAFGDLLDTKTRLSYDNVGRVSKMVYADGTEVETEFDNASRLIGIPGFIDHVAYSERGLLDSLAFANGAVAQTRYDSLMRIESVTNADAAGKIIEGMVFDRDRMGNVTKIDDMSEFEGPGYDAEYGYDAWYRVTSAKQQADAGDETISYMFDKLDRVQSIVSNLDSASGAHVGSLTYDDARPLLLQAAGEMNLSFDDAGQLTARGDLELAWDFMSRITTAEKNGQVQQHVYGGSKERVAIVDADSTTFYASGTFEVRDGVAMTYVRVAGARVARHANPDFQVEVYTDSNADGQISSADAWLSREDDASFSTEQVLGAAAMRMLIEREDAKSFLHTDHLGSIVSATDEGGDVTGRRAYGPTGVLRADSGYVDPYGFTGQEYNTFTQLIQFKMRDFDPQLTRWASFDPAFMQTTLAGMNMLGEATTGYAYVSNNFSNKVDPLGLSEKDGGGNKSGKDVSVKTGKNGGDANGVAPGNSGDEKNPGIDAVMDDLAADQAEAFSNMKQNEGDPANDPPVDTAGPIGENPGGEGEGFQPVPGALGPDLGQGPNPPANGNTAGQIGEANRVSVAAAPGAQAAPGAAAAAGGEVTPGGRLSIQPGAAEPGAAPRAAMAQANAPAAPAGNARQGSFASRHMGKIAVGGGLAGVLTIVGILVYLAETQ